MIVLDTRLSNTATHADHWLSPRPGSEAAILLAIANHLIQARAYDREFVRRWWNWAEYLTECHPGTPVTFEAFEEILAGLYAEFTFEFAAAEAGLDAGVLAEVAEVVAGAGHRFACHIVAVGGRRATSAAGRWRARCSCISALLGAVATRGRDVPERVEQVRAAADPHAAASRRVERADLAAGVPAGAERDVVPAAALPQRGPRQARRLLHPRLQPGVDQPGRAHLDARP